MTFKKEISMDGIIASFAILISAIGVVIWLTTIKNTQDTQGKVIEQHTQDIRQINQTQASIADSVSVLTTIVNERTGAGSSQYPASNRR